MPYDDYNFESNIDSSLLDNDDITSLGPQEIPDNFEESADGVESSLFAGDFVESFSNSDIDYSTYLEDIISNQETIILNQTTLIANSNEIRDNGYRLYYFVGGLYVAFAIVIMIKFFKTFLF